MSGWFLNGEAPVPVPLGECLCPGTPHADGDTVYLRPALDFGGGLRVTAVISSSDIGGLEEDLGRSYLAAGIVDWTFLDDKGEKVPVTHENVSRLRWTGGLIPLANMASDLYGDAVLGPLLAAGTLMKADSIPASASLPSGPSGARTSPTRSSSSRRRKR